MSKTVHYAILASNLHDPWGILDSPKTCWCGAYICTRGNVDKSVFKLVDRPTPPWQMEKHQELTPFLGKWEPGQIHFYFTLCVSFKSEGGACHIWTVYIFTIPYFSWIRRTSIKLNFFFFFPFRDLTSDHKRQTEHSEHQRLLLGGAKQLLQAERKGMT